MQRVRMSRGSCRSPHTDLVVDATACQHVFLHMHLALNPFLGADMMLTCWLTLAASTPPFAQVCTAVLRLKSRTKGSPEKAGAMAGPKGLPTEEVRA